MSRSLRRTSARTDLDHLPIKDHMYSLTLLPWPLLNVPHQVCTNLLIALPTQASLQCAYPSLRGAKQNCDVDAVHKTRYVLRSGVFGQLGKRLSRDEPARKANTLCPHVASGGCEHRIQEDRFQNSSHWHFSHRPTATARRGQGCVYFSECEPVHTSLMISSPNMQGHRPGPRWGRTWHGNQTPLDLGSR